MDPLRIAVRVLFAYAVTLAMLRVSGKRSIKHTDLASFVVALILGDMFDDVFWAEVSAAQFVVGSGTLVVLHLLVGLDSFWRGTRQWRAESVGRAAS
jgi:uncharacterized membrane protein YcaP (DUF421 family)